MVFPALKDVKDFIQDTYLPQTRTGYGVGTLGKGVEYYRHCLRQESLKYPCHLKLFSVFK